MLLEAGAVFDRMIVLSLSLAGGTRSQIRNLIRKQFRWAVWIKHKTLRQQLWHRDWEQGPHRTLERSAEAGDREPEGGPWRRRFSTTLSATSGLIIQVLLVWVEETLPKFIFAIKKWIGSHFTPTTAQVAHLGEWQSNPPCPPRQKQTSQIKEKWL